MGAKGEVFAAHDYSRLMRRWRAVARRTRLALDVLAEADGWPVLVLHRGGGGLYVSAGIHGDEAAGCEALVTWAESEQAFLRSARCAIFPCLNPWGLIHNSRTDGHGRDLNRCYDRRGVRLISAHRRWMRGRDFEMGLTLHEDFDARGVYLYEVGGGGGEVRGQEVSRRFLKAAARALPLETRRRVEGMVCKHGLISRRKPPANLNGLPEALWLSRVGCPQVWTLETPSEMDLCDRVRAQCLVLREFQRHFCEQQK